jgi:protein ImuB
MEGSSMFACIHSQNLPNTPSLADFAYAFSPLVEETSADTVVIDTEGCELLFGSAYELANEIVNCAQKASRAGGLGCKVNVALARNPDAAIQAARCLEGITYIAPGEELAALGDLPVEALCPTLDVGYLTLDDRKRAEEIQGIFATLRMWGVRTFRDFAALPTTGVAVRLGQEGVRLQQLAGGQTERHLKLRQPAPVFENSFELEHPIAELEPLSFIFARLLNQLCANLNAYALATNEIRVQMKLTDHTIHERKLNLPYPLRDHKVLLKLVLFDTEMHPPAAPLIGVTIACESVKPRMLQNGLFVPLAPQPEKLELTLARLAKLVGAENLGSPEVLDTNRPGAFQIKKFSLKENLKPKGKKIPKPEIRNSQSVQGFRVFRPPLRAIVEAGRGYPTQVTAWGANKSVHGKVVRLGGPWRTTGDWWRSDSWARDEWDVAIENRSRVDQTGAAPLQILCRIYRELNSDSWFVEGIYD